MEPGRRSTGDELGEGWSVRSRLLEQGASSHAGRGRCPALGASSAASLAPSSSGALAAGHESELEWLRGYLEFTQAALRVAELKVDIIFAQLVAADGRVAGKSSPAAFASPCLLYPTPLVFCLLCSVRSRARVKATDASGGHRHCGRLRACPERALGGMPPRHPQRLSLGSTTGRRSP